MQPLRHEVRGSTSLLVCLCSNIGAPRGILEADHEGLYSVKCSCAGTLGYFLGLTWTASLHPCLKGSQQGICRMQYNVEQFLGRPCLASISAATCWTIFGVGPCKAPLDGGLIAETGFDCLRMQACIT